MAFDMDELNKRRQKRRELKDQSEKKQKKQTLVMIGIVAFLIIAIAGVLVFLLISQRGNTPQSPETTQGLQSRPETLPPLPWSGCMKLLRMLQQRLLQVR